MLHHLRHKYPKAMRGTGAEGTGARFLKEFQALDTVPFIVDMLQFNGPMLSTFLTAAVYDYDDVQSRLNGRVRGFAMKPPAGANVGADDDGAGPKGGAAVKKGGLLDAPPSGCVVTNLPPLDDETKKKADKRAKALIEAGVRHVDLQPYQRGKAAAPSGKSYTKNAGCGIEERGRLLGSLGILFLLCACVPGSLAAVNDRYRIYACRLLAAIIMMGAF